MIKEISTWNIDDIKSWLQNMNMSQYIPNFSSNQISGYDLVYLTKDDMKSLGISNIHDINIILNSVKELILQQLKLTISFEGKTTTIQLDCDRNYTVEKFTNTLTDIFKPSSKIFLLINSNEILMPNLKIVDLILHNPSIYKNFKIIPSERLPTLNYSPKIGEYTPTTSYTNSYNTMRNNNYYKDKNENENNGNKQNIEKILNTNSYIKPSKSSKSLNNLGNYEKYRKSYLDIQEPKIDVDDNDNDNNLNNTNDILFNRYRNLGEYNSNLSKPNIDINNYLSENNSASKEKNNFYNNRNNIIATTQLVNQRIPSLDLKTNLYNNNSNTNINTNINTNVNTNVNTNINTNINANINTYANSNNMTSQPVNRQKTIPNYRKNYGLQNGELSIEGNDDVKNNNNNTMNKIDYSQTVYDNFQKENQKDDDIQRYSSEKRGFRGLESGNNFYNNNNLNNNNFGLYKNLNADWKNNSNAFAFKNNNNNNNYMTFSSTTPKITERRQYDSNLKVEMRGFMGGFGEN